MQDRHEPLPIVGSDPERRFGLARGAVNNAFALGLGLSTSLATQIVFSRLLGADGYGLWSIAVSVSAVLLAVSSGGLELGTTRVVAGALARGRHRTARQLFYQARRRAVAAGLLVAAIAAVILLADVSTLEPALEATLLIALVALVLDAPAAVCGACIRALGRVFEGRFYELALRPAMALAIGLTLAAIGVRLDAPRVQLAWTVASALVLGWLMVRARLLLADIVRSAPTPLDQREEEQSSATLAEVAGPLRAVTILRMLLAHADVLAVAIALGPVATASYAAARKLAKLAAYGQVLLAPTLAPRLASDHAQAGPPGLRSTMHAARRFACLWGAGAVVVLIVAGPNLLALWGRSFLEAYPSLVVLAVGNFASAAAGPAGLALNMAGRPGSHIPWLGMALAFQVGTLAVLLPLWGTLGAAIATSAATICLKLATDRLVRRQILAPQT